MRMGHVRTSRRSGERNKCYKRSHKTDNRARDIDQIQDDLKKEIAEGTKMKFEHDDDLPGLGQFYCTPCARHFADQATLDTHLSLKKHKRRMRDVAQKQYSHDEANLGANRTKEVLPPAHAKP